MYRIKLRLEGYLFVSENIHSKSEADTAADDIWSEIDGIDRIWVEEVV